MKAMEIQTNFRKLIDAYLKENCKENTYAMYSATLLEPNVKRVQILRKLFGLPAAGKAIADLTLKEMQKLDEKLGKYIKSAKEKECTQSSGKTSANEVDDTEHLNWKYAYDIRSHLHKCIDFLETLPDSYTFGDAKRGSYLVKIDKYQIQGEVRSVSYPFGNNTAKSKKFTFVPDQKYSAEESFKQKRAMFLPIEPESNINAYVLPYDSELEFECDLDTDAMSTFPEKILGPVTLILEENLDREDKVKITYKDYQLLECFSLVEIIVLKHSRNAY